MIATLVTRRALLMGATTLAMARPLFAVEPLPKVGRLEGPELAAAAGPGPST